MLAFSDSGEHFGELLDIGDSECELVFAQADRDDVVACCLAVGEHEELAQAEDTFVLDGELVGGCQRPLEAVANYLQLLLEGVVQALRHGLLQVVSLSYMPIVPTRCRLQAIWVRVPPPSRRAQPRFAAGRPLSGNFEFLLQCFSPLESTRARRTAGY